MGTHVTEVELTAPGPIQLPDGVSEALVLVRWNDAPVGLLRLRGSGVIAAERVLEQVAAHVPLPQTSPYRPPRAAPLTVVVCTRERPDDLVRCLAALAPLAAAGHQLVVVDNAPLTDATAKVAARFPVQYECEPRVGLSHARNRGLQAARHPLVACTDDDAVPDAHWVDALADAFDERIGCVTGLVLPIELRTEAQHAFEVYAEHRHIFTTREFSAASIRPAAAGVVGFGANMALRRDLALRVGGFDPRLGAGARTCSGEENDMFARLLDAGASIAYTPNALVWHRHRETEAELRRCIFGYGVGLYAFLTKRLVEQRDLGALTVGARWLVGPFLRAAQRRLASAEGTPLRLLLLEAAGASLGPIRFLAEDRRRPR